MPTPPKESIKGTKSHHITAFDFAQKQFNYIKSLEVFAESEEFIALEEDERAAIIDEIDLQNQAYETLRIRVDNY